VGTGIWLNLGEPAKIGVGCISQPVLEPSWIPLPPRDCRHSGWSIDAAKKYVLSSTLDHVDWNAELVCADPKTAVEKLKQEPGKGLLAGGVTLPLALGELGLIDEYESWYSPD
jgi:hypothetical protein